LKYHSGQTAAGRGYFSATIELVSPISQAHQMQIQKCMCCTNAALRESTTVITDVVETPIKGERDLHKL
jgi:hypothetical protein